MKKDIETRIFAEAEFILKNRCTIREVAKVFYISKSTIHYDLSKRLKKLNFALFSRVKELLEFNYSQRYLRGGNATKIKFQKLKNKKK